MKFRARVRSVKETKKICSVATRAKEHDSPVESNAKMRSKNNFDFGVL